MRAALLQGPGRLELVDRPVADLGVGQVRLRVTQCGLCTSEVDLWLGRNDELLPALIGHEVAGVVDEVGPNVRSVAVGDGVAAWIVEGGFADQVVADEAHLVKVAPSVDYPAVAEPLSCVVNAVELAAPGLGDNVLIIGAGYMGALLQLVTALKGPRSTTVADIRDDALVRADELGASRVVNIARESLVDAVAEITDGHGADVTYEVTGIQAGLDLAGETTRMSGKLCIVGYHQGAPRSIPLGQWNWMAFQIVNAHFRSVETIMSGMRKGVELLNAGVLDVSPLRTNVYRLDDLAEAFEAAVSKPDGFVKAVVEMPFE
jgi:L-iditol 2-dehydrogenase